MVSRGTSSTASRKPFVGGDAPRALPHSAHRFALAGGTKPCLFLATPQARPAYGADFRVTPPGAPPIQVRRTAGSKFCEKVSVNVGWKTDGRGPHRPQGKRG